jgi:DNA ligase-1
MNLYEIIKSLQNAQGNINKQKILDDNKDNEQLKTYMKAVYDPAICYYQTKIAPYEVSNIETVGETSFKLIHDNLNKMSSRAITGNEAKARLSDLASMVTRQYQELLELIIARSIGASVGETMVLKTWPDLFFVPPYQRCSLMDAKAKAKFGAMDEFYIQTKLDGSFAYLSNDAEQGTKTITRNGSNYPSWFTNRLTDGVPSGFVMVGEMTVSRGVELLSRKEGNGILNSVLQGGDESDFQCLMFIFTAWDCLTVEEFKAAKSAVKYSARMERLKSKADEMTYVDIVDSWTVSSLPLAYEIYSQHTKSGLEGCVVKSPDSLWKNGTAKDIVKLKIKFPVEAKVVGYYEGEGKAAGMLGGVSVESSCGKLRSNVGSGFSDKQRKDFWENREKLTDSIFTLEANDITSSRGCDTMSLFLPIFIEHRLDKTEADSLEQMQAQFEAAKQGV